MWITGRSLNFFKLTFYISRSQKLLKLEKICRVCFFFIIKQMKFSITLHVTHWETWGSCRIDCLFEGEQKVMILMMLLWHPHPGSHLHEECRQTCHQRLEIVDLVDTSELYRAQTPNYYQGRTGGGITDVYADLKSKNRNFTLKEHMPTIKIEDLSK